MRFEQQASYLLDHSGAKEEAREDMSATLTPKERGAIVARAELRIGGQEFRVEALSLERPKTNEALQKAYDTTLARVFQEVKGSVGTERGAGSREEILEKIKVLETKGAKWQKLTPLYGGFLFAQVAQLREGIGEDFSDTLAQASSCLEATGGADPHTPSNLLPQAMLLGMKARQVTQLPLPEKQRIAKATTTDAELLTEYALILSEKEREEFLMMISGEKRMLVSSILDASVSRMLHQSLIDKKSDEDTQRSKVRLRLYHELRSVVEKDIRSDKVLVKVLAEALGGLGEDARQLLLEIVRDESEQETDATRSRDRQHIPRVIKVLLENFDDFRGNDLALQLAGDQSLDPHLSIYLFGKLIEKGYLPQDVKHWWSEEKAVRGKGLVAEQNRLEVIRRVVTDLGVMPSREILGFISDDRQWRNISIGERIGKIRESQQEFSLIRNNHDLATFLQSDGQKAMMYYLLHGGDDRFNLINNYSFDTFKEMVGLIADLRIHDGPLRKFEATLAQGAMPKQERLALIDRLKQGNTPYEDGAKSRVEISFNVSENAAIKNANMEIGRALGREQLGVVMTFPLYRNYLEQGDDETAKGFLETMKKAQTLSDRRALIGTIETRYPDFRARALSDLKENWKVFSDKMMLDLSLEQMLGDESVVIRGEELLPRLDMKRIDLKRMKKDMLVLLKGGNKRFLRLQSDIAKKRKARANLLDGIARQEHVGGEESTLRKKVTDIENELFLLEQEKLMMSDQKTTDRFAHMTEKEKTDEMEKLGSEILALTEKSPSAIFTYIMMQVLGEEMLRESDIALVQEVESHLQGPFQMIADAATYQKSPLERGEKKRMRLTLEYLDKTDRFMNMVRFADSKICCFSSNNYEQTIQHETPNKFWVASINADPLSFVLSLEMPTGEEEDTTNRKTPKENLGFIFGNYGVDENGGLAVLLNGIYYAPGIEGKEQTEAILTGVERIFSGLPVRTLALAEQHGGSLGQSKMPTGYTSQPAELIRLRALDDNSGNPESKIYDDLGTGGDLNGRHAYGGHVWHKSV